MKPDIRIFRNLSDISANAAAMFAEQASKAIDARGLFLTALSGGSTPAGTFQQLATGFRDKVDWSHVQLFWGDERCVPAGDPGSSYGQARDLLLQHVPIPEANIHRIEGELSPVEAASNYSRVLQKFASPPLEWPRFDLVFLGMGEDGHTASLFPGPQTGVQEPVLPVTGQYQGRPAQRVTLTPLVFNSARRVVFLVAGENKAATLAEVLSDRYQPELYPAQRIDPKAGKLIWLLDEDAAGRLPMELVRRFCEG